jgi:hypothetical protein
MGFPKCLRIVQNQRIYNLTLVILFAVSIVSADVSLHNSYSTSGSESREEIYLHDMQYSNSASISSSAFSANSQASADDKSKAANFQDDAYMNSIGGTQGAGLKIDAKDLGYTRSMGGGQSNSISFSYSMGSGIALADYFTPTARYDEALSLVNNTYKSDLAVFDSQSYSFGTGHSPVDDPSSFTHNVSLIYLDKYCVMNASLETGAKNLGTHPLSYDWSGYSSQRNFAVAGISMNVIPGNRTAEFGIEGDGTIFRHKFSPDPKNESYPAKFDTSGRLNGTTYVTSKRLIMQYRLNQSS